MTLQRKLVTASPAYAGIDPLRPRRLTLWCSLPRIRGDRPLVTVNGTEYIWPPPHTRGSTWGFWCHAICQMASPAYAGIDLSLGLKNGIILRLPRIRGDRPQTCHENNIPNPPPPHTRGSTILGKIPSYFLRASPAYAGIDLGLTITHVFLACLPRIRGDRPFYGLTSPNDSVPPPHTRGSTLVMDVQTGGEAASPAYAGIDPIGKNRLKKNTRLPRIRGDRPPFH